MSNSGIVAILLPVLLCALQTPPGPQTPPKSPVGQTAKPQTPSTGTTASPPAKTPVTPLSGTSTTDTAASDKTQQSAPFGVTAEPNPCLPGQTVTFTLPDGAIRCVIKGGKYEHTTEFKPDEIITDEPKKETAYIFDVLLAANTASGGNTGTKATQHQQYKVTVSVYAGKFPRLVTYRNPQHWHIDTVAGWIRDVIPQPDPATQSLIYFQPQDDSPERVAVAVTPVKATTCAELMKTALMDAPTQYDVLEHIQQQQITQCGVPATWATFDGIDHALPDIPTKSIVMTFVRNGTGYVISGRARASRFDQWAKLLHSLVRSFAIDPPTPPKPGSSPG
jgi:hypothetical protein